MPAIRQFTACRKDHGKEAAFWLNWHPDLHGFVVAAGGDAPAVWRPCYRLHFAAMSAMGEDVCPTRGIPYLHRFIVVARRYARTVWRPCYCRDGQAMPAIGEKMAPGGRFPDLHGAV